MELIFKPGKGDKDHPLQGYIKLNPLSRREKYSALKDLNLKFNEENKIVSSMSEQMEYVEKLDKFVETRIIEIKLKDKSGKEYSKWSELDYVPEFDQVVMELGGFVLNGGKVGEN